MLQLVNYRGEGRALACKYENKEYQKNKVRMCAKTGRGEQSVHAYFADALYERGPSRNRPNRRPGPRLLAKPGDEISEQHAGKTQARLASPRVLLLLLSLRRLPLLVFLRIPRRRLLVLLLLARRTLRGSRRDAVGSVHGARGIGIRDGDVRVRIESHQLGLRGLERRAQSGVLDPELVDDRPTFLPSSIRLIRGGERGVEQLRA